jgi:ABC-type transport system involved in multi-copper enzyme maturation permease subunit
MPIYSQGYRRYRGVRTAGQGAWRVIAAAGVRSLFRRRGFVGLLALSQLPFLVRAVQIYASANVPQAEFLAPTPELFRDFLGQQQIFMFLLTVYAGSGLIANDRRARALQIYLSKPLTRAGYVIGKGAVLFTCLLLVTWVPAMALLLVQVMFAGNLTFVTANLHLIPAITLASLMQATTVSAAMLALSSMSSNSRYVGIAYAGVMFFSQAIYVVLYIATRDSSWSWVSFPANLSQLSQIIFRSTPTYDTPWPVSVFVVLATIAASMLVLRRQIRGVELVA